MPSIINSLSRVFHKESLPAQPSDPVAQSLFEGVQVLDPNIDKLKFTQLLEFSLHNQRSKPKYFTKRATNLTYALTLRTGVIYVHTGKEEGPIGEGGSKKALICLKIDLAKVLVEGKCELTVRNSESDPHSIKDALKEDKLANSFDSPYLMKGSELAFQHRTEDNHLELSLFQELMDATAKAFIKERSSLQEREKVVADIGQGLIYLHEKKYVHRDIKPDNVLVRYGKDPEGNRTVEAKITDFGLTTKASKIWPESYAGTMSFLPDSLIHLDGGEKIQGPKTDIYSFGVTVADVLGRSSQSEAWTATLKSRKPEDRPDARTAIEQFQKVRYYR